MSLTAFAIVGRPAAGYYGSKDDSLSVFSVPLLPNTQNPSVMADWAMSFRIPAD
jgi:hypothetical protein